MTNHRLHVLDGMRGVAAVAVLCFHMGHVFGLAKLARIDGPLAVTFFFMLSGFVLGRAHGADLRSRVLTVRRFMLARVARVWPWSFSAA